MFLLPISTNTSVHRTPWANYALMAICVLVFLIDFKTVYLPEYGISITKHRLEPLVLYGEGTRLYQFISYQFLHDGYMHIAGNMLFLWIFGNAVNAKLGHAAYVLFYLACGIFAAVGHMWMNPGMFGMVGASGAIAGVTTAYLALFPRSQVRVIYWWFFLGTFELSSIIIIVFKIILWDNVLARQLYAGDPNAAVVAVDAHLAGYLFGFAVVMALLALRMLPRDQFDMVALVKRWHQRQQMQAAMADPNAEARARFGRVARPVSVRDLRSRTMRSPHEDRITELRGRIDEALSKRDRSGAGRIYEELLEIDSRQVLSKQAQLEIGHQFYVDKRFPQAAAAFEKFLGQYEKADEADEIRLLLGIIYARDLKQYEVAEECLKAVYPRLIDDRRKTQCRHWLDVSLEALGRLEGS